MKNYFCNIFQSYQYRYIYFFNKPRKIVYSRILYLIYALLLVAKIRIFFFNSTTHKRKMFRVILVSKPKFLFLIKWKKIWHCYEIKSSDMALNMVIYSEILCYSTKYRLLKSLNKVITGFQSKCKLRKNNLLTPYCTRTAFFTYFVSDYHFVLWCKCPKKKMNNSPCCHCAVITSCKCPFEQLFQNLKIQFSIF